MQGEARKEINLLLDEAVKMSNDTRPDWANKAEKNEVGKQVGQESHPTPINETQVESQPKKKPGRKKALLQRKKVMFCIN